MMNPATHRILVWTGGLLWCVSFIGEGFNGQPLSTVGIILSPIVTGVGVYFWFQFYRATRGQYPKFKAVWDNISFYGFDALFLIKHFLEFWTLCILFQMALVLLMVLTFGRSDVFEVTKQYCQNHQEILTQTGEIKYFGVLVSGHIFTQEQGGKADLSFTIVGRKGNFGATSKLSKQNGFWTVDTLTLD